MKNGKPDAFVNEWEPFPQVWDPVFFYLFPVAKGQTAINPWGVTINWGENEPGIMPIVNEKTKVCPDITEWRKTCKAPDLDKVPMDWTNAKAETAKIKAEDKFSMVWVPTGVFEQLHFLMGFEDTLMNFIAEPDAMHELIDYVKESKMQQVRLLIENLRPDVVMFHDDWGSKHSMFMSPDTWREFFKEPYREIYGAMKKEGVITMHHADSFCEPIAQDMVDVGIDIWEGILPSNDIQKIKKDTNYKLTLMGGIDASIVDRADWTEEVVRAETARACREYHEGGMFIPCLTYGGEGSIYPGVNDCIMDEIRKQSKIYFK
ncbi:MAG: uroporphyrinogen decarboxylase (URO-D) [Deltaproteobacteria bacterium]|nr:uroporphyrinogen decarboxylase (URO-D) [Deltaproteobacteria bacterium]